MPHSLRDGLYRVVTDSFCAGFELRNGEVIRCAPILRKRINYWITRGEHVVFDPFAPTPADPEGAHNDGLTDNAGDQDATTVPARPSVAADREGKVVVTLKGGTGFDAPWLVFHADSIPDANAMLSDPGLPDLVKRTVSVSGHFIRLAGNNGGGSTTRQGRNGRQNGSHVSTEAPPQRRQAPNGERQYCEHGERVYVTGISRNTGNPFGRFDCPEGICEVSWPSRNRR